MSSVVKINSKKGLVTLNQNDLIENNLIRYIRTSSKGIGKFGLLTDHPFETVASFIFKEKYPSDQIKIAEKCMIKKNGEGDYSVDVLLRISQDVSDDFYAKHPDKAVFNKPEQTKG
jgi:hypothetical protein